MKRVVAVILGILLICILAVVFLPNIWKPRMKTWALNEINERVDAKVHLGDIDLIWWRSFPHLRLQLNDLTVNGVDSFTDIQLANIPKTILELDLKSVIRKSQPLTIRKFIVKDPIIELVELQNGHTNYSLVSGSNDSSTDVAYSIDLKFYEIQNGRLQYRSATNDLSIDLKKLDHKGKGAFSEQKFVLETETSIDSVSVRQAGISYLKNHVIDWKADFDIDNEIQKYSFLENTLAVNDLKLLFDGWYQSSNQHIDLSLNVPSEKIKTLYSIVPGIYQNDYKKLKASGAFTLNGQVSGVLDAQNENYPNANIALRVSDGELNYPDLPKKVEALNGAITITNRQGSLDNVNVKIRDTHLQIDKQKNSLGVRHYRVTKRSLRNRQARR